MATRGAWLQLERTIVRCERCPRLRRYSKEVARVRRRAYRDEAYWGRPLPGFGDTRAKVLLVGLAPAAHGANRTGRMFTGDSSGEWLFASLHRVGLASQPVSRSRDDGLALFGAFVTAACRCAPPDNRPAPGELGNCAPYLDREIELLRELRVVVPLGKIAWDAVIRQALRAAPGVFPRPRPAFSHGATTALVLREGGASFHVVGSYHPSRQNTQTGRLTRSMLDSVLARAARLAGIPS
jgi:uracil-DNA glycosylase family 4